ncbi:hypothetical protein HIM_03567 [Hirsutella minnesotensis 3608]|uniref:peptidyl-tRNA hydrolase n=1 Tax=Hirsutella minnesotensis 3608 TaxID=1043627 RepID=A0A0F7ZMH5_9HYPO|nr:hypothetical protein HIM_03567 [Hirsutella minnesotensis 3608]
MFNPRFLVVSLGNPLPKYSSLHSAGHFALNGLAKALHQPSFRESRLGNAPASLVSTGPKYTLVQSPVFMNVSGQFVAAAWRYMCTKYDAESLGLVLLHDELEKDLGVVSLVSWQRSPRGHNGVKDVKARLQQDRYPNSMFARVSVGIGRPEERDAQTVSEYVLRRISNTDKSVLEDDAPFDVVQKLVELEEGWKLQYQQRQSAHKAS